MNEELLLGGWLFFVPKVLFLQQSMCCNLHCFCQPTSESIPLMKAPYGLDGRYTLKGGHRTLKITVNKFLHTIRQNVHRGGISTYVRVPVLTNTTWSLLVHFILASQSTE